MKLGFENAIDAFHNVAQEEIPRFFDDSRRNNQGITLTDNFYKLLETNQKENFKYEVNSRWELWETAISMNINPKLLEIKSDFKSKKLFVIKDKLRRIDVTSSTDALNGYQKGKCFYCFREISILQGFDNSCEVDHFFPDLLKYQNFYNIDQVWNLVLSCRKCNRGVGGKFERIPHKDYLEELNKRNNWYIDSHDPLKETIINQTGKTLDERIDFFKKLFDRAVDVIPSKSKWKPTETHGEKF